MQAYAQSSDSRAGCERDATAFVYDPISSNKCPFASTAVLPPVDFFCNVAVAYAVSPSDTALAQCADVENNAETKYRAGDVCVEMV